MARDGTARGHGAKPKAGRPAKALKEKVENGNPGKRPLKVIELPEEAPEVGTLPEPEEVVLEPAPMPREYMAEEQHQMNTDFYASEIFRETMEWLDKTGCRELIEREVVDLYVMSAARWIQSERAISKMGLVAGHPTTGAPIASPFASLSNQYSKTMMNCFYSIYQIVKENCVGEYKATAPHQDVMEQLLSE